MSTALDPLPAGAGAGEGAASIAPPSRCVRAWAKFLVEIAQTPPAAALVWAITALICAGALWSERFPFNAGTHVAWSLHSSFGTAPVFRPVSAAVFTFLVLLVLMLAWVATAYAARRGRLSARLALVGALVLPTLCLIPPGILSEDTASYWSYGRIVSEHDRNPYVTPPDHVATDPSYHTVADVWKDMPSNYGPGFVWIAAAVSSVSGTSFATAVFLFKLLALLGTLVVTLALWRQSARMAGDERALRLVLWGWNPIVTLYLVGGGHNDSLVAVGLALAAIGIIYRRHGLAFAGIVLAALMKPVAIIAAPVYAIWLWMRTPELRERIVAVSGATLSFAALALSYVPFWGGLATFEPLRRIANRVEDALPVGWIAARLSGVIGWSAASFASRVIGFAALVIVALWILNRIDELGPLEVVALAFSAVLLVSTYTQPWYLAWVLVLLCFGGRETLARWWGPVTALCVIWGVKAIRNQWRFRIRNDESEQFESFVHSLQGLFTLCLIGIVVHLVVTRWHQRRPWAVARPDPAGMLPSGVGVLDLPDRDGALAEQMVGKDEPDHRVDHRHSTR